MKFEHTRVMNFEGAFRGMRNALESWDKSDSWHGILTEDDLCDDDDKGLGYEFCDIALPEIKEKGIKIFTDKTEEETTKEYNQFIDNFFEKHTLYQSGPYHEVFAIGSNDMKLAQKLIKAGSSHRKFMRQIMVSVDITAPIFLWKEVDTYKVGTVANSTSTMHKLSTTPITPLCFEMDDFDDEDKILQEQVANMIDFLEGLRNKYLATKDKKYWKELIRWLPESWLQKRTITLNYEVLIAIVSQREGHKLSEWKAIIDWIKTLPYAEELIFYAINCNKE